MNEAAPDQKTGSDLVPLDEERAVILRLQQGDRSAFAILYGWYADALFRQVILPRLPQQELAEDVLRDTFKNALEKIQTFRIENRSIFFWLRRIAANKAMDVHRLHKRDARLSDAVQNDGTMGLPSASPQPDRRIDMEETKTMVETSLSRLNERYAQALRLRLIDERDREECASILGVSLGNFDVILHRAAAAFRKVFPP